MKGKDEEKERLCSSRIRLEQITPDLKMATLTRLPGLKTHQRKLLCGIEFRNLLKRKGRDGNDTEDDEKERSSSQLASIPVDLEVDILTRLPGKTLMKCQCVSKMWSSIIRSQRFIDSFFAMSLATRSSRFIIAFSNGPFAKQDDRRLFIFSSSHEGEESSSLVTNLDIIIPSMALINGASKCGSVHGFIGCTESGQFLVCNPSTGKLTSLPGSGGHTYFGYDPVDRQFKALNLVTPWYGGPYDCLVHDVITLGGEESSWRRNRITTPYYNSVTQGICINGFVYFGAWNPTRGTNPVIVCFDVRYETVSFIKAPKSVVYWEGDNILIEYKGKLASIVRDPYDTFNSFDLWILEDVKKHDWSKQTFELPFSLVRIGRAMTSPGTNQAGEIIFAPTLLSRDVEPFYIFYYNVERKDMRKVMLRGIADDQEFRRRYGLVDHCPVSISPQHLESIASL